MHIQPTMEVQGRDPQGPAKGHESLQEEGKKFSVAMFPIEQAHKVALFCKFHTPKKMFKMIDNRNESLYHYAFQY